MASYSGPLRMRGGRSISRVSFGVMRRTVLRPCFACASAMASRSIRVNSMAQAGCSVIGGSVSNSTTSPGASSSTARCSTPRMICRYWARTSGKVAASTGIGGRVKLISG